MAHGAISTVTDSFTGSTTGNPFMFVVPVDPTYPIRAHLVSVITITGSVTGAAITYDVQLKDGTWQDSGQPSLSIAGVTTTVFRYDALLSSSTAKGFRTRISGWTGGTSAAITTTVVYLV